MTASADRRITGRDVINTIALIDGQNEAFVKKTISRLFPKLGSIFQSLAPTKDCPPYVFSPMGALALALVTKRDKLAWSAEFRLAEVFDKLKHHPHAISHIGEFVFHPLGIAYGFYHPLLEREAQFLALAEYDPKEAYKGSVQFIRNFTLHLADA